MKLKDIQIFKNQVTSFVVVELYDLVTEEMLVYVNGTAISYNVEDHIAKEYY